MTRRRPRVIDRFVDSNAVVVFQQDGRPVPPVSYDVDGTPRNQLDFLVKQGHGILHLTPQNQGYELDFLTNWMPLAEYQLDSVETTRDAQGRETQTLHFAGKFPFRVRIHPRRNPGVVFSEVVEGSEYHCARVRRAMARTEALQRAERARYAQPR